MSAVYRRGRAEMEANLTPMIDVTFLLIVFFVLVSQIVEVEHVDLNLPQPERPLTARMEDDRRVVINVVPRSRGSSEIESYRVGGRAFPPTKDGVEGMIVHLAALYAANPNLNVNLRADRATHYEWVEPAMRAVVEAASRSGQVNIRPRVNLVVIPEDDGS